MTADLSPLLPSRLPRPSPARVRQLLGEMRFRDRYRADPAAYARDVLGRVWTPGQVQIAESVRDHPVTLVPAGHGVGKSMVAGGLVSWWLRTRVPSIVLSTAPKQESVRDILWGEIRRQIDPALRPYLMPADTRLTVGPNHYAAGMVARVGEGFQGRHSEHVLIVIDEAVGVSRSYLDSGRSMLQSDGCRMLVLYNPTDPSTWVREEEQSGRANVVRLSCLDHPNVAAELCGEPAPYPDAVRLSWVRERLHEYFRPGEAGNLEHVQFAGEWWDPTRDPRANSRVLGRFPGRDEYGVWDSAVFDRCCRLPSPRIRDDVEPVIGCDVARFGADETVVVVRRGPVAVHHEAWVKRSTKATAERLRALANQYGPPSGRDGSAVPIRIDEDGIGGGVVDQLDDCNVIPVSAGSSGGDRYPNMRSRLWFEVESMAVRGEVVLSLLSPESQTKLKAQLLAPRWRLDAADRREVEPKDMTRKRLGRSPDDADAFNLCYADLGNSIEDLAASQVAGGWEPI